jgi:AraC family transcriptional regulator
MNAYADQALPTRPRLVDAFPITAPRGHWDTPAINHISLGVILSNFAGKWRGKSGFMSSDFIEGDVAICEYGQPCTYTLDRSAACGVVVLSDELMRDVSQETRYQVPDIQRFPFLRDIHLNRLTRILLDEGRNQFESGSLFADSIATALAQYLWNRYSSSSPQGKETTGGMAPALLRRSIEFIRTNLNRDIRLEDLAREAGLSRSHYIRSFRQSMGITPHQYLLSERVKQAQSLIRKGAPSLAEIALSCGFADQHHLARIFRRFTGMTPKMFRGLL